MLSISSHVFNKFSVLNSCCRLIVIRNYAPRKIKERTKELKLPDNPGLDKRLKHFKDDIMEFENDSEMIVS